VFGGIVSATFLTLLVLPALYATFERHVPDRGEPADPAPAPADRPPALAAAEHATSLGSRNTAGN
jgi:hypothetical protein